MDEFRKLKNSLEYVKNNDSRKRKNIYNKCNKIYDKILSCFILPKETKHINWILYLLNDGLFFCNLYEILQTYTQTFV